MERTGEKSSCLDDGEICGTMHWADLAMKYSTEASSTALLARIEKWWKVVLAVGKRACSLGAGFSDGLSKREK